MKLGRVFTILTLAGLVMVAGCQDSETDANGEITLSAPPAETEHFDQAHLETAQKLINDGIKYLVGQQRDDGGWGLGDKGGSHPAITAMVLKALVQHPDLSHQSPRVKKGFDLVLSYQQGDGGFYDPEAPARQNYTTAVAVMALAAAENPAWQDHLDKGVEYLKSLQIVPGSKTADGDIIQDANHPFVGGVSYGKKHGRPDLSNLGLNLMAMEEAGVPGDSEHVQRALTFVTRTQVLSETNPLGWAERAKGRGGFIYAPAKRDGKTPESKVKTELRSYGSMTYTGFKSMLYAGVDRQDPRVQAAWDWIRSNWTLQKNPAMPGEQAREGLYYYYHVFAKALRAWGEPVITDKDGEKNNWRHDLTKALKERVNENGSWVGVDRWYENYPEMATVYSVLALEEALKK